MMIALGILAAVVTYFVTMSILLTIFGVLQFNVRAFGLMSVQPYRAMLKWAIIGASGWAAYAAFLGGAN